MRWTTISIFIILFLVLMLYAAFHNSDEWVGNENKRRDVYERDYPNLNASERLKDFLKEVDYVAVVYPKAIRIYPNSWFHQVILGNPPEGTTYTIKAKVEYTLLGDEYKTIEYASSGVGLSGHSRIVGLCETDSDTFYAPDNGYEIPATKEAMKFAMSLTESDLSGQASSMCSK